MEGEIDRLQERIRVLELKQVTSTIKERSKAPTAAPSFSSHLTPKTTPLRSATSEMVTPRSTGQAHSRQSIFDGISAESESEDDGGTLEDAIRLQIAPSVLKNMLSYKKLLAKELSKARQDEQHESASKYNKLLAEKFCKAGQN
jgi:hypothetical protein